MPPHALNNSFIENYFLNTYVNFFGFSGSRHIKCSTEAANIRHNQCAGGDRSHREEKQKLHSLEGSRSRGKFSGN